MPLSWFLALRFLREGRMQTVLIVAGASVGVGVVVFLSALITGLQTSLVRQTLGTQAHVVVRPPDEVARPQLGARPGFTPEGELRTDPRGATVAARVERPAQRVRAIVGWARLVDELAAMPDVVAVSPTVSGAGFVSRGTANKAVVLFGVDPARFARIYQVDARIRAGRYRPSGVEAVIGTELADDLGVGVGDKIRVAGTEGRSDVFTVGGVFDLGNRDVNRRWVIVSMRAAQTLLDFGQGVSSIDLRVREIFDAERVARVVHGNTGLVAESWMQTNAQLLVALRSQDSSSQMIQFFVIVAVAMGIASVLIVSVVQKSREIGILRAMGASRTLVNRVFLIQGGLVGVVSAALGSAIGAGLATLFAGLARNADGSPTFPVTLDAALFGRSCAIALVTGLLAAVAPSRRAARLDPAVAIHNA